MEKKEIEQLFENNCDCYADTREECLDTEPPTIIEGEVVMAMTKDKFVEVLGKVVLGTLIQQAERTQPLEPICISSENTEGEFYCLAKMDGHSRCADQCYQCFMGETNDGDGKEGK